MKLIIRYMVCNRCIMAVREVMENLGLRPVRIELGEVELPVAVTPAQLEQIRRGLHQTGLELIDDKHAMLVEQIKSIIVTLIHHTDEPLRTNFSDYLSEKLNYNYTYLSNLFSDIVGTTIEQFILLHKIERVKELILYGDLNITEIADRMHYSSVAHLSRQFKQITGLTPSHFRSLKDKRRKSLDDI